MLDPIVIAMISLGGNLVLALTALFVYRREREERRRAELLTALQSLMSALDLIRIERERRVPLSRFWEAGPRERPSLGDWLSALGGPWIRLDQVMERYATAINRLFAVAPQETLARVERANELLQSWEEPGWIDRADEVRLDLAAHIRELGGGEPASRKRVFSLPEGRPRAAIKPAGAELG